MALIDLVKWDNPGTQVCWKFPSNELSTATQLIVNESQTATLFKGGQRCDVFGPGRHSLSADNLPILNKLVNLPFGRKSPFTADEVWFVNQAIPLNLKFGTPPVAVPAVQFDVMLNGQPMGPCTMGRLRSVVRTSPFMAHTRLWRQ